MPLVIKLIEWYIDSSSSKKDDLILDVVKKGAEYLAPKSNNDLTPDDAEYIKRRVFNNVEEDSYNG